MSKETIISGIAAIIGFISLFISGYSLKISSDAEERNEILYFNNLNSVIVADYDEELESLKFKATEENKYLSYGGLVFPDEFEIEPVTFSLPENKVFLEPIKSKANRILKSEGRKLYDENPARFKDVAIVLNLTIPIYAQYSSTVGGDSVITQASYKMLFSCAIYQDFLSDSSSSEKGNCIYKSFIHDGRVTTEPFKVFYWPWETESKIQEQANSEIQERIKTALNNEWNQLKPSAVHSTGS